MSASIHRLPAPFDHAPIEIVERRLPWGLLALLGTMDKLIDAASDLPFAKHVSRDVWEVKLLLLLTVFIVAYFKFTWSLRQFNMLSLLVGAAPPPGEGTEEYAQRFARINALSGDEFNRGIRAYYFGLAAVFWFVDSWIFAAITTLIVAVLYRRDFRSWRRCSPEGPLPRIC